VLHPPGDRPRGAGTTALAGHLAWASGQALARAPAQAAAYLGLRLLIAVSPAVSIRVTQHLINLAIAAAGRGPSAYAQLLPWLGLLALSLVLTIGVVSRLQRPISQRLTQHLEYALGRARLAKAARLPLLFFERHESYDRLERAAKAGREASAMFSTGALLLGDAVQAVTVAVLFLPLYRWLPPVLVAVTALQAQRQMEAGRRIVALQFDQTADQRRGAYLTDLLTGRAEQKEIRVFTLHETLAARWLGLRRAVRAGSLREQRQTQAISLPADLLSLAVMVGVAVLLVLGLGRHAISTGAFVALFEAVAQLQSAVRGVLRGLGGLQRNAVDVGYLRDFLALPEDGPNGAAAPPADRAPAPGDPAGGAGEPRRRPFPAPLREGIRCEGLTFTYPGRERTVLDGLDLLLRPHEVVALVGENGAGKSTLVKCLLGLYRPDAGRITADGVDYGDIDPESLRDAITAAYQDHFPFELTAAESIGVGAVAAVDDREAVVAAARQGGADAFVAELPQGYETPIGHVLDGASDLSGGQWQRIAVSRAFMRRPQLLILDEPTASLDPRAEAEVYARLGAAGAGRAVLLISHRLGSARLADRILVLQDGRIAEDGRHDDLVRRGGLYARMWEEQAQWYR